MARRLFAIALLCAAASCAAQDAAAEAADATAAPEAAADADAGEWIEHFDKSSGKPFYYHAVSRKTAWEPPAGAKVRYMDASERGGSSASGGKSGGSSAGLVMLSILLPIGLPFLGLFYCYWAASKEGLADVLKSLGKKRDRASKRRGTKAGGNFRQRQKTSQDGKGGRSANS